MLARSEKYLSNLYFSLAYSYICRAKTYNFTHI